jgi:hypothetical protein
MKSRAPTIRQRATAKLVRWQSRFSQKLLLPFAPIPNPDRWIFIVGCYNSGTSLLSKILSEHPRIVGLPDEGIYFTDALPYPEQFGWPRMWTRCLSQVRIDPDRDLKKQVDRIKKQWALAYRPLQPNLLEKSVANSARIPFLDKHFRPAYFIHIVRNGYAVSEGIHRRANPSLWNNPEFNDKYPIALCAEQWRAAEELIKSDRGEVANFHSIKYEDLTSDPLKVINEIYSFLGLESANSAFVEKSWFISDRNESIRNMNDNSIARLSATDIDEIQKIAGPMLEQRGYVRP